MNVKLIRFFYKLNEVHNDDVYLTAKIIEASISPFFISELSSKKDKVLPHIIVSL
jgi:hypothetical protein